jgi:hypothetical protein
MEKVKKNVYFCSQTDNNIRIIDHNNQIAYSMSDLGLGHFVYTNQMITIVKRAVQMSELSILLTYIRMMLL